MINELARKPSALSLFGLSCMVFLISDIQGGVGPFISLYLSADLNWNAAEIGLVLATYNIASLLSQIPSGMLIDLVEFKQSLIAMCTVTIAFGCLLIVHSSKLMPIIIAQSLIGMATSIIPPAITAITLGLVGREAFPTRLAINNTFYHAGNVFIALATGIMARWLGIAWVLYIGIISSLASIIPLYLINRREIDNDIARECLEGNNSQVCKPILIKKILTSQPLIIFGICLILFTFSNSAQLPLVGLKIIAKNPGFGSFYMASSIILAQVVMIVVAYVLSFVIRGFGRKPLFITSFSILIVRTIFYTLTDNPNLLLANQVLDGIAAGIFNIVSVVIITDLAKNSGRFNFMQGIMIFCISIGAALSNLVAGYISKLYGIDSSFRLLTVIAIIGLLFYTLVMPETKGKSYLL